MSKATVYNTLNLFASHGLIRQLSVDGSRAWFDSNVVPHYHFHDEGTGALMDVAVPDVEFSRLPSPLPGMEVAGIDLVIRLRKKKHVESAPRPQDGPPGQRHGGVVRVGFLFIRCRLSSVGRATHS